MNEVQLPGDLVAGVLLVTAILFFLVGRYAHAYDEEKKMIKESEKKLKEREKDKDDRWLAA